MTDDANRQGPVGLTFDHVGRLGPIIALAFKIFLLNIVTLTIYRFWGRTEVRRYLWGQTTINGEPLEYTGTGLELLLGFIVAVLFVFAPLGGIAIWAQLALPPASPLQIGIFAGLYVIFFYLIGVGTYQAWRYRLSRTAWQGVRLQLDGSAWLYGLAVMGFTLLNIITLGLLTPVVDLALTRRIARNTSYGNRLFKFEAHAGQLYPSFILAIVLGLVVVTAFGSGAAFFAQSMGLPDIIQSLDPENLQPEQLTALILAGALFYGVLILILLFVSAIYAARSLSVKVSGLRYEGLAMTLHASTLSYLWLNLGNLLIVTLTFGFGLPIAQFRTMRYIFTRAGAQGTIDLSYIAQAENRGPRIGEGLAEALGQV